MHRPQFSRAPFLPKPGSPSTLHAHNLPLLMLRNYQRIVFAVYLIAAGIFLASCDAPESVSTAQHASVEIEARVDSPIADMTRAEQIGKMTQAAMTGGKDATDDGDDLPR